MKISKVKFQTAMANACMNVSELSAVSNVSKISIYKYLAGKREPRTKTLGKIARALNVPVTEIIEE